MRVVGLALALAVCLVASVEAGGNSSFPGAQTHGSFFAQYTVGIGPSKRCGGTTPRGETEWKAYGFDGLYAHVDTHQCNFTTTPQYASSLIGVEDDWQSTGTSVLLKVEKTFFKVVIIHTTLRGDELLAASKQNKWQVSWIGDTGENSGTTVAGKTGWIQGKTPKLIKVEVATKACKYKTVPRYFTSLVGFTNHWRTLGGHVVYFPKKDSFTTYISYDNPVTPKVAEGYKWQISWLGYSDSKSGVSGIDWKMDSSGNGLYIDVDTSASKYGYTPAYVTAATTEYMHWDVNGGGSVYKPSKTGFRLYLDKAVKVSVAKFYKWKVNYVAYDGPVGCVVGEWSKWGACSKLCDGEQTRTREVLQAAYHGGLGCPSLNQTRKHCNLNDCTPLDCRVSKWKGWSNCSRTCGSGVQHRDREVVEKAMYKGKACPALSDLKKCKTDPCPVDCKVGMWSNWTKCTRRCGRSDQHRHRALHNTSSFGGKACPKLIDTKYCYGNKCIGSGPSKICGGVSPKKTKWEALGTDGVKAVIDTSLCNYDEEPEYIATLLGADKSPYFSLFNGGHTIANSTEKEFTIVVWLPNLAGTENLQIFAMKFGWQVSWISDSGSNSGRTVEGKTGWKNAKGTHGAGKTAVFVDVDTSKCDYSSYKGVPLYFTSLHGDYSPLPASRSKGANVNYMATDKSFRVFAVSEIGQQLTAKVAETSMWTISWIGLPSYDVSEAFSATTISPIYAQKQDLKDSGNWHYFKDDPHQGIYTSIGTHKICALLATKYHRSPPPMAYVSSISGQYYNNYDEVIWNEPGFRRELGTMSINGVHNFQKTTKCGFDVHLGTENVTFPNFHGWSVVYAGFTIVDCSLSKWTKYTPCTATCGGGSQHRTRKIVQTPLRGGKPCPADGPGVFNEERQCNMDDCIGTGKAKQCGGISSKLHSKWKAYGTHGLQIEIGTAFCRFQGTVQYAATIVGDTKHWQVIGSNSVVEASNARFKVIITHPTQSSDALAALAVKHDWQVSWVGATGSNTGSTDQGFTGWMPATDSMRRRRLGDAGNSSATGGDVIMVKVDTTECGFFKTDAYPKRPSYFIALRGDKNHWRTHGAHVVYAPTRTSFKVFVHTRPPPYDKGVAVSPKQAEAWKWTIGWIALADKNSGSSSTEWKDTADQRAGPQGTKLPTGVFIDVDTTMNKFRVNPSYITCLESKESTWHPTGAAVMLNPSKTNFRIYLPTESVPGSDASFTTKLKSVGWDAALYAQKHQWKVNYFGYQGQKSICGAKTPRTGTPWKKFGKFGLYLDVDTSDCGFKKEPQYMTTVNYINRSPFFGFMKGTAVMAKSDEKSFRVILYYPALTGYNLVQYAKTYKWHLSWLADTSSSSGRTAPGRTGWKQATTSWDGSTGGKWVKKALYVDVDTEPWGFVDAPRYLTMLHGTKSHYKTQGSNIVYAPTAKGFRIYVVSNSDVYAPELAETNAWTISWIGTSGESSGTSDSKWVADHKGQGLFMDIDTSGNGFKVAPTYVVAVVSQSKHWTVNPLQCVDMSIDEGTYIHMRVYLDMNNVTFPTAANWRVNYVGYQVVNCEVSDWTDWSECSVTCDGGTQKQVRKVIQYAEKGGRQCPDQLQKSRGCNPDSCDTCQTTEWSKWSDCACKIGPRATKTRFRNDIGPVPGMKHCMIPDLHKTMPCWHECQTRTPAPTPKPTPLSATEAEITSEKAQAPAVKNPTEAVIIGVSFPGLKETTLSAKEQKQLVTGVAGVLGVNSADVAVNKITQQAGSMQAHMSVNQGSVTDATAIQFFMGSGNFNDLLSAELKHVGFPVGSKGGALVSQQMKIVPLNREQQAGAAAAAVASSQTAPPAANGTRQLLLLVLAVVGVVYVVIAVRMLMAKKAGQVEAEDGNEGAALVGKGEASGYGGEQA